jgi:diguanylate cyclase (GGDEF)-like protein
VEFAALLGDTDLAGALLVGLWAAEIVRALRIDHSSSPHGGATVICGVGAVRPHGSIAPLELLERADRALYRAKSDGRDRTSA